MAKQPVSIVQDHTDAVLRSIRILTSKQVLIGFPEDGKDRDDVGNGEEPTNAQIGYIHETGSPLNNLPARPFLVPGVSKSVPQALSALQIAAEASLDGDTQKADRALNAAGMIAASSAKREIATANFIPIKDSTIWHRRFGRMTKSMRPGEIQYFKLRDQGMSEGQAQDATGIQPLVNTGQLRNAITYVVRERT